MVSVHQTVDTAHEDIVHDAQLNYYGTVLATCSSDESIKLFDVRNKKQVLIAELNEHHGPVWGLSWSHPLHGNLLASCSYDKKVIVWREVEGQWGKFYEYADHESSVNCVCWAPHEFGLMLACGSSDGCISICTYTSSGSWEVKKIQDAHMVGVNAVSWAPAMNADFMLNPSTKQANKLVKRIVSGGCDSMLRIWREDKTTGGGGGDWIEEARLESHSDWVRDVAWAPSLSPQRQQIASCGQDGRVIVWQSSVRSSTVPVTDVTSIPHEGLWQPNVLHTYPDVVWHVSWSLTGNILAVSGGDNKVTLWKESLEGSWIALSEISRAHNASLSMETSSHQTDIQPPTGVAEKPSVTAMSASTMENIFA